MRVAPDADATSPISGSLAVMSQPCDNEPEGPLKPTAPATVPLHGAADLPWNAGDDEESTMEPCRGRRAIGRVLFKRNQGVRLRSTIVGTLLVAIALAIGAAVMLFMLGRADNRAMYDTTSYHTYEIANLIADHGVAGVPPDELVEGTGADVIQIVDAQGRVVASSPSAPDAPLTSTHPAPGESTQVEGRLLPDSDDVFCGTVATVRHGTEEYRVIAAVSAEPYRQSLTNTAILLAVEMPFLVLIAGFAIYYFVGRALRPVGRITSEVNSITTSDLSRRVPVPATDDEVTRLATTMNAMLERLERSHDAHLRFVGDASHELRSPLTTIVGLLDLADCTATPVDTDTVRTILLPEARRVQHMVDDLLLLARADENGLPLRTTDVDLDDIVVAEARRLRSLGMVAVETSVVAIRVSGDSDKLARALRNLTDNAARYASSTVRLDMSLDSAAGRARIAVSDDGPGISSESRNLVFDRFTRVGADRRNTAGSGLGLSITREIVRAHGGQVSVEDPHPDLEHGATMVISLPVASTAAHADHEVPEDQTARSR